MKKYFAILVAIVLIVSVCALCACNNDELTLYVPDGAPALSVANIVNNAKVGDQDVRAVITTGEDVVAKCASGEADMAVLPTNAAVKICSERDDYQIFSVNVYGVLYIVGTEQIASIADLQGETLYSIGLGNTPEYVFKTVCNKQGISYVGDNAINLKYEADASTIIPQILGGNAKFALIGEPAVTQLMSKAEGQGKTVYNLFDLQQLWQIATDSDEMGYPQASMIVKKDLLTDKFAKILFETLSQNTEFLKDNIARLSDIMLQKGSSLNVNYTLDLINRCNLTAISASDAKLDIERYLSAFTAMKNYLPVKDSVYYEAKD